MRVHKTQVQLRLDRHLIAEIASWVVYLSLLTVVTAIARLRPAAGRIWFAPDLPRPWYMVRGAALFGGLRAVHDPARADMAFYFNDVTREPPRDPGALPGLNFACADVSKSRVARVFEEVFGYPLAVDPLTARGEIVEKAEKNGVHDGRIVTAPLTPREGYVYQRVVDTTGQDGLCRDLRTPTVGGRPVVVWIKTKPGADRFSINNRRAVLREPGEVYSPTELALIARFSERMGLDWGGLDILRDRADGRLYIVDVNKTDVGPVIALSWADKIRSMRRLGLALGRLVAERRARSAEQPVEAAFQPARTRHAA